MPIAVTIKSRWSSKSGPQVGSVHPRRRHRPLAPKSQILVTRGTLVSVRDLAIFEGMSVTSTQLDLGGSEPVSAARHFAAGPTNERKVMDALVMLREEHKAIKRMFREFERGDLNVVADFCRELMIHSEMEEAVLYPAIREAAPDTKDIVMEGIEEHHEVKLLIGELNVMTPDEDHYKAKATVVMENSEHHFGEEEEDMFPKIRKALGRNRLIELGTQMAEFRTEREQASWAANS